MSRLRVLLPFAALAVTVLLTLVASAQTLGTPERFTASAHCGGGSPSQQEVHSTMFG